MISKLIFKWSLACFYKNNDYSHLFSWSNVVDYSSCHKISAVYTPHKTGSSNMLNVVLYVELLQNVDVDVESTFLTQHFRHFVLFGGCFN